MQTIFGIILGVFLTVGAAYIHDASVSAPVLDPASASSPAAQQQQRMVNWDVVGDNWRALKSRVDSGWHRLQSISIG